MRTGLLPGLITVDPKMNDCPWGVTTKDQGRRGKRLELSASSVGLINCRVR